MSGREGAATPGRLGGKVALVIGAGSGIGRAIARVFARTGATAVLDRDGERAAATLDGVVAAGGQGPALEADVALTSQGRGISRSRVPLAAPRCSVGRCRPADQPGS